MKAAMIIAAAAGAMAQNLSGIPACATSCIASAISGAGCAATDVACQCGPTQTAIAAAAAPCIVNACTAITDLLSAQAGGSALCAAATATGAPSIQTNTEAGASSTSAAQSSAAQTSAAATNVPVTSATHHSNTTTTGGSGGAGGSTVTATATTTTNGNSGASSTSASTTGPTGAAASPVIMGAGALVGLLGFIAAL